MAITTKSALISDLLVIIFSILLLLFPIYSLTVSPRCRCILFFLNSSSSKLVISSSKTLLKILLLLPIKCIFLFSFLAAYIVSIPIKPEPTITIFLFSVLLINSFNLIPSLISFKVVKLSYTLSRGGIILLAPVAIINLS